MSIVWYKHRINEFHLFCGTSEQLIRDINVLSQKLNKTIRVQISVLNYLCQIRNIYKILNTYYIAKTTMEENKKVNLFMYDIMFRYSDHILTLQSFNFF